MKQRRVRQPARAIATGTAVAATLIAGAAAAALSSEAQTTALEARLGRVRAALAVVETGRSEAAATTPAGPLPGAASAARGVAAIDAARLAQWLNFPNWPNYWNNWRNLWLNY